MGLWDSVGLLMTNLNNDGLHCLLLFDIMLLSFHFYYIININFITVYSIFCILCRNQFNLKYIYFFTDWLRVHIYFSCTHVHAHERHVYMYIMYMCPQHIHKNIYIMYMSPQHIHKNIIIHHKHTCTCT